MRIAAYALILTLVFCFSNEAYSLTLQQQLFLRTDFRPRIVNLTSSLEFSVNSDVSSRSNLSGFTSKAKDDFANFLRINWHDFKHLYSSPARITTQSALWLGGIVAVGGLVYAYDQEIVDALKRNIDHPLYKPFNNLGETMEPLGFMGFTNKYYFGAFALGYIFGIEPVTEIVGDILASYALAAPAKSTANIVAGRRRPSAGLGSRSFKPGDGTSFPSGHSLNVMQLAGIVSYHTDNLPVKIAAYTIAVSIAFQRITARDHWPSDVYFGTTYGFYVTRGILRLKKGRRG